MGSRRTLLSLTGVALALAVGLIVDLVTSGDGPVTTRILPGFDPDRVAQVSWRYPGELEVVVQWSEGLPRLVAPVAAPVDAAAIEHVLGTLEMLSSRHLDTALSPPQGGRFAVIVDGVVMHVGPAVEHLDRVWLRVGATPHLIDGFAARALERRVDDLRVRRALEFRPTDVTGIELAGPRGGLRLVGRPLFVQLDGGGRARADPSLVARLLDLASQLRIDRFVADGSGGMSAITIRVRGGSPEQELVVHGPCPQDEASWLASTPVGRGCIHGESVQQIVAVMTVGQGLGAVDRQLVRTIRPSSVAVGDIGLKRSGGVWRFADGGRADADAVERWLMAIRRIVATSVEWRRDLAIAGVRVVVDDEVIVVDLARGLVHRDGEQVVLHVADTSPFAVGAHPFYERAIFAEQPLGLRSATRGTSHIERGASHDDWVGGTDIAAIAEFRAALARLRAERFLPVSLGTPVVTIDAIFDPAPGQTQPRHVMLSIDARCRGRTPVAPAVFEINAKRCAALRRPW